MPLNPKLEKAVQRDYNSLFPFTRIRGGFAMTLDFFFRPTRDAQVAKHFLRKTLVASHTTEPRVINVDKNAA